MFFARGVDGQVQLSGLLILVPVLDPFHAQVWLLQLGADLLCPCSQVQLIGDQTLVYDEFPLSSGASETICFTSSLLGFTSVSPDADGLVEFDFVDDRFDWLLR